MKNNQLGRSMIEMLGVLSIIGVLSVGGFGMVKKMQNNYNTNKIIDEISGFTQKARIMLREYDSDSGATVNAFLSTAKAYPDGITYDSGAFSGTSDVTYSFAMGSGTTLFNLTVGNVPEEVCMQIATADWGSVASSGFKSIKVGEGSASATPLSLGDAADLCSEGVSIVMSYR